MVFLPNGDRRAAGERIFLGILRHEVAIHVHSSLIFTVAIIFIS